MIINGERKTLVLCLANAVSEDALGAVWFSSGNGSVLEPSNYGISQEEDGTFSAISHISISTQEFESWDTITCYVAQNQTSSNWSTSSLQISEENVDDPCLDESQGGQDQTFSPDIQQHNHFQVLLLLSARILLFKILLSDVLMTCCLIYKSET
ncbi:hypothetical protein JRQ81_005050 [Phrynocephalus forsythii]|uniref:Ig-like domain-containing protein n=1 Tax=Phrynocephalus forsythii TaxID=171643 RepID=A0A9Q0Y3B9_9SAUR|nr:hypothetical protein JRQ81_005050 [Phrynocephalus forsythii]